jgi:two-component system, NtrC family, nitrogen regulation sensor histidine kinase NtrY
MNMLKRRTNLLFLLTGLLLMTVTIFIEQWNSATLLEITERAANNFKGRASQNRELLSGLSKSADSVQYKRYYRLFEVEKTGVYTYVNQRLVFWNNARFPIPDKPNLFSEPHGLIKLSNGYYFYLKSDQDTTTHVVLNLVKPEYGIQNNYLSNDFEKWTDIPAEIRISGKANEEHTVIFEGEKLFSIKGNDKFYHSGTMDNLSLFLFLFGFLILLSALIFHVKRAPSRFLWMGILIVFSLRTVMIYFNWPAFFYRSDLYDVRLFGNAQSFFNGYIGDIVFNSFALLFVSALLHFAFDPAASKQKSVFYRIFTLSFIFILYHQFNQTLLSLVGNSTLSFNFLNLFNIKWPAFAGVFALVCVSLALFVSIKKMISFSGPGNLKAFSIFLFTILGICFIEQLFSMSDNPIESYWLPVFAIPLYINSKIIRIPLTLSLALQVIIISLLSSAFFNFYISKNQRQELEVLSQRLGEMQDAILENEFALLKEQLQKDEEIKVLTQLMPESGNELMVSLRQKYFSGYLERYKIDLSLFDNACSPLLSPKDPLCLNQGYLEDQIRIYADSIQSGLFFVNDPSKNARYIGRINLDSFNLFVVMERGHSEEWGSFPDLMLDASLQRHEKLKTFSHAVYRSGLLMNRYGSFSYPHFLPEPETLSGDDLNYQHYFYQPEEQINIIISVKSKSWKYFFTFNSYVLLFFSVVAVLFYVVFALLYTNRLKGSSLTRRIQAIIVVLLLLSISIVGVTSGRLVKHQFESDNKKDLEEKKSIIVNELTREFKTGELFNEVHKELVSLKLKDYARLFNTPISLFSERGTLYNSSEPKLYELGLAAKLMNPKALQDLKLNLSSTETANEMAGNLNYASLYTPLSDGDKSLSGFLNLPSFARQGELADELSGTISALINVYVILFVVSILAGLILSGYITRPLRIISAQFARITLGRKNEKIHWNSNDEIGRLVTEYNRMLVKLEDSAEVLAQSERESAWREMAKQVAHEIKNPLTPMKLNLQYLQRLINGDPESFKEHFRKASEGIISQIDALASIASEFSSFAKLPAAQLQPINLSEIIKASMLVFEDQDKIGLVNLLPQEDIIVKGDRDQCLRVFNNIFANAISAVEGSEQPLIKISSVIQKDSIVIAIADNGSGIDDYLKKKIFTPNFTTKNTGSGLGLPIVKNIMEGFGGKVWFDSEKGNGTVFYLEFVTNL